MMPNYRLCAFFLTGIILALPVKSNAGSLAGDTGNRARGKAAAPSAQDAGHNRKQLRIVIRFKDESDSRQSGKKSVPPWVDTVKVGDDVAGYGEHLDTMIYPP